MPLDRKSVTHGSLLTSCLPDAHPPHHPNPALALIALPSRALLLFASFQITILALAASGAHAQLRPFEPMPTGVFDGIAQFSAEVGLSRLQDQRASLAGTSGTLTELGLFAVAWRTGRVALEVAGTARRNFEERSRFAAADAEVAPSADGRRQDSGDYRISTVLRFTPEHAPITGLLRFGTRLPTTDNRTGLDRDVTDFFFTLGASGARGPLTLAAEAGLGIHGTREPRFEQDDLLLYAARAEWRAGAWTPSVMAVGQWHGIRHPDIRSVEDLGEVRLGLRYGRRHWVRVEGVRGHTRFAPSSGIRFTAGFVR